MGKDGHPFSRSGSLFWGVAIGGVLVLAGLLWLLDLEWFHDALVSFHWLVVCAAVLFLPLVWVPVSVLYAVVGAKFGLPLGFAILVGATAGHLALSWGIGRSWLKQPLERLLSKRNLELPAVPEGSWAPVCLLAALMPGVSYTLKNYLVAIGGAPFRTYFLTMLPAHLFHASLALLAGDFAGGLTAPKIVFLIIYAVVVIGLGHVVYRRLKRRETAADGDARGGETQDTTAENLRSTINGR